MNRKRVLIIVVVVAAVVAGVAYSAGWFRRDSSLQGSGTVEARDIRVGSKVGGRIDKVLVREGDTVQAGQVLITFDDKELQAALDQSRAAAEKARRGYRPEEIAEARAAAGRSQGRVRAAPRMAIAAKISRRRKPIWIVRKPTRYARDWTSSATTRWRRKISSRSNSAIPRRLPGELPLAQQQNAQHKLDRTPSWLPARGNRVGRGALSPGAGDV